MKNKFKMGRDGNREEVIEKYKRWLWGEIKKKGKVWDELVRIKGIEEEGLFDVVLRCWCKPKKCHGDVIKSCIEWMMKVR